MIYYSYSAGGFFNDTIHSTIPVDAVEISQALYTSLLVGQAEGRVITCAANGVPSLKDPPPPTVEQFIDRLKAAIQESMDTTARASGFDDLNNAISYADEPAVPVFQAQGQAFRAWRSRVWAYSHEQIEAIRSHNRDLPTAAELIAQLPALVLPA